MKGTDVYATDEEFEKLSALVEEARNTPVIAFTSAQALGGRDCASMAWDNVKKACHEAALAHDLPEIQGYYGLGTDKEFVVTD